MADVYSSTPNAEGFGKVIDFTQYIEDLKNNILGRRYRLVPAGKIRLPDGTEQDQMVNELGAASPDAPVDDYGADYVVGEISLFMNKHAAMGNLHNDQRCRRLAADITNNIIAEIASSPSTYGCSEEKFGALGFRMRNVQRSLYTVFTAIKDGAILDFGRSTTGAQTTTRLGDDGNSGSSGIQRNNR